LKGANILVDSNGKIKLADFGCAKSFEASLSNLKGQIKGSLPWMAPELIVNKTYGRKADIWSLGCVIVEMAVGGNPWGEDFFVNQFDAVIKIANTDQLPNIPQSLSLDCRDFISKCLLRDSLTRPSSEELLNHPFLS
jgi:serine/threonine protein kinase